MDMTGSIKYDPKQIYQKNSKFSKLNTKLMKNVDYMSRKDYCFVEKTMIKFKTYEFLDSEIQFMEE